MTRLQVRHALSALNVASPQAYALRGTIGLVLAGPRDHREGEVFRRPDGLAYERPRNINDTSAGTRIKKAFDGACRRSEIDDFHPHDCRHTWATWHYAKNRDLGALMKLGGWKTVSMVLRYAHTNVEELAPSIDRLPGGNLGDLQMRKGKIA